MRKRLFLIAGTVVLALLIYIAINWKPILLSLSGFEIPRIENGQTVADWPQLQQTHYDLLMAAASKESYYSLQKDFGLPGIIIFNKQGLPIVSSKGEGCQVVAQDKLKTLRSSDALPTDTTGISIPNIEVLKKSLNLVEGNLESINVNPQSQGFDYIAVYTWAKYFPERSSEMMKAVADGLKESEAKILVISLNLDYMEDWSEGNLGEKIEYEL